jgi:hypothetical protein
LQPGESGLTGSVPPASFVNVIGQTGRIDTAGAAVARAAAGSISAGSPAGSQGFAASGGARGGPLIGTGNDGANQVSQAPNITLGRDVGPATLDATALEPPAQQGSPLTRELWAQALARDMGSGVETASSTPASSDAVGSHADSLSSRHGAPLAEEPLPAPSRADLISNLLPLDRQALEQAVDRFFSSLAAVNGDSLASQRPQSLFWLSMSILSMATLAEIARRRLARRAGVTRTPSPRAPGARAELGWELIELPEFPTSWSRRRS